MTCSSSHALAAIGWLLIVLIMMLIILHIFGVLDVDHVDQLVLWLSGYTWVATAVFVDDAVVGIAGLGGKHRGGCSMAAPWRVH